MNKARCIVAALAAALVAQSAWADWKPEKPINLVVPYPPGGVTDQVMRVVAAEMKPILGQEVVVVNKSGASGSVGTRAVMEAQKDGYTWLSGGVRDLGTFGVMGMLDTRLEDWNLFVVASMSGILSVSPDRPWKDLPAYVAAAKGDPGKITVATTGFNSSGGVALGNIAEATGIKVEQVIYDGGAPSIMAVVSGEVDSTTQLAVEQAQMIQAKKLRPLAVIGQTPMELKGVGKIPPITDWYADFPPSENYVGVYLPVGVPDDVIKTMAEAWNSLKTSEKLADLCATRGCGVNIVTLDEAQKMGKPIVQAAAWSLVKQKANAKDPKEFGIEPLKK